MPLCECWEKVTYREFLTWQAWLNNQWNEPSRTDYYLMQIAAWVAGKAQVNVASFRLPFTFKKQEAKLVKLESAEKTVERSKSRWFGFLGIGKKKKD